MNIKNWYNAVHTSRGLFCALELVATTLIVLLFMSCAARKEATRQTFVSSLESTSQQLSLRQTTAHRPAEMLTLSLPVESLRDTLPEGAVFTKREGAVTITARPARGADGAPQLSITATCDSLMTTILELESKLEQVDNKTLEELQVVHRESQVWRPPTAHLIMTLGIGVALGWWARIKLTNVNNR